MKVIGKSELLELDSIFETFLNVAMFTETSSEDWPIKYLDFGLSFFKRNIGQLCAYGRITTILYTSAVCY